MAKLQKINPEWQGSPCVVAAPGPSLDQETALKVKASGWPVLVCQDAWRLMPWADKLYGCDARWWDCYEGVPEFAGEKWSTHGKEPTTNDKAEQAAKYGLKLVRGVSANDKGFSMNPAVIHYGDNSGYQSINLAVLLGSPYIVLVGFDMLHKGKGHFFGAHPSPLHNKTDYEVWVPRFRKAAEELPRDIVIVNATPNSALDCWPNVSLETALANGRLYRDRTKPDG